MRMPSNLLAAISSVAVIASTFAVGFAGQEVGDGKSFSATTPQSIELSSIGDAPALTFTAPVNAKELQSNIVATGPSGAPMPLMVQKRDERTFDLLYPRRANQSVQIALDPAMRSASGQPLSGPTRFVAKTPALSGPGPGALRSPRFYGVNTNRTRSFTAQLPAWLEELNVGFVRQGWSMDGLDPTCLGLARSGDWNWQAFDSMLDRYGSRNIGVVLTPLQFGAPPCATGGVSDRSLLVDEPQRYADFVEAIARRAATRHPGVVIALELGNEPDSRTFWKTSGRHRQSETDASSYFAYLKPAALAAKRVRAETRQRFAILNGGFAGGGKRLEWWSSLMAQPGLGELVDGLNVHIYPWAGAGAQRQAPGQNDLLAIRREAEIAAAHGLGAKAFWITEVAVQTWPHCPWAVDEDSQAEMLVALLDYFARSNTPRVEAVAWFTIQDDVLDRHRENETFSLSSCYAIQGLGLIDDKGRRRPAFHAYRDLIRRSRAADPSPR